MIADPWFYAAAVPAVLLVGLSKGGFGGSIGLISMPLMSLAIPPLQAAGIMLPILIVMDLVGLIAYRRFYDAESLRLLLPAALAGIGVGWLTAAYVTAAHVRLIVGLISVLFALDYWFGARARSQPGARNPAKGRFWGMVAGFTSFASHAGGPPFQMYLLPLRLEPRVYAGTAVLFFAAVNAAKLLPYFLLGQFSPENLATSAALLPLAPLATLAGVWLVRSVPAAPFYRITYACVFLVGLKLMWDGMAGLGLGGSSPS